MKKISIKLLVLIVLVSTIQPATIYAEAVDSDIEYIEEDVVLFSEVKGEEIELFKEVTAEEPFLTIPDDTEVILLNNENNDFSLIRYIYIDEQNEEQTVEGYVYNSTIIPLLQADKYREERELKEQEESNSGNEEVEEREENVGNENTTEKQPSTNDVTVESEENISSKQLKITTFSKALAKESKTSLLGHIRNKNVKIYETIGGKSIVAGDKYTNAVYYIKRQAKLNNETFYLISTQPSDTNGVVGWVKSNDLSTHRHVGVDKQKKTFFIKGNGKATTKAWGGSKDTVYPNLTGFKNQPFQVHLTEKVGNNIWYRGKLQGKTVWLHSSYVESATESKTSLLGHIRSGNVLIYNELEGSSFKAGEQYTNAVYYIKRQAKLNNETFYLISLQPSDTKGVVGWVKSNDLSTHRHVGVDKQKKTFFIKGNGKATTKAWGGNKDTVYSDLTGYKNQPFQVHLTEKVGNNIWYRGILDGKTVWLHSNYVYEATKSKTSLLGHIRSAKVNIYETIGGKSFTAGSKYTNAVYYIKEQAKSGKETYYLISTEPSNVKGVVGWVKSSDLSSHRHVGVDKKSKTFYIKGNGKATTKAWGGSKDTVYSNLSKYKHQPFQVHLTEKVGNNTWYRGVLDGKTVWLHSNYVVSAKESKTSMLGHIRSQNVDIHKTINGDSFKAGSQYTNAVYYIKKQAILGGETFYLISTQPSDENGVVGWVKSKDLSTHPHISVDKKEKVFYVEGTGKAFTKAWGGSKDTVYSSLSEFDGEVFRVNLTEKVGNNTWYRGKINGNNKTVWIHSSYLSLRTKTNYNITLDEAIDIQFTKSQPRISKNGSWVNANKSEIRRYMDPSNFISDPVQKFQFLNLRSSSGASVSALNDFLHNKGTLHGQGKAFRDGARSNKINELYLISHAQLETGHGTSLLANGSMQVGKISNNKWVSFQKNPNGTTHTFVAESTLKNGKVEWKVTRNDKFIKSQASNIKTTYNMFGIGAFDSHANVLGSIRAYEEKWFSPDAAIRGGAKWISGDYIYNQHKQNTLYKMRWNPNMPTYVWKQYASDVAWASKQANIMYEFYKKNGLMGNASFDIPVYK